jgi:voltage-gated potassium channel
MIEGFRPGSFEISPKLVTGGEPARPLPQVLTYYSFVTLTTVGYGDISPVSPATRTLAWMEAITGQFYLAVIVAGLVSVLAAKGKRAGGP